MRKMPRLSPVCFIAVLATALTAHGAQAGSAQLPLKQGKDSIIGSLHKLLSDQVDEKTVMLNRETARTYYLEGLNQRKGMDGSALCTNDGKDSLITETSVPATSYKSIPILGSPYPASAPYKETADINDAYLRETLKALKVIESRTPEIFEEISSVFKKIGGYITFRNFCTDDGLTLARFNALSGGGDKFFTVMLSSSLVMFPEFFNEFDIASALVHEAHGHAVEYYQTGSTSEDKAFTAQIKFAELVGDDKFMDSRHTSENLKFKIRMSLTVFGDYVNKPDKALNQSTSYRIDGRR